MDSRPSDELNRGIPTDWNDELQRILVLPETKDEDIEKKNSLFLRLCRDFYHQANVYARVIVSEAGLPDERKTIRKEQRIGGVAGGAKFLCHNMYVLVLVYSTVSLTRFPVCSSFATSRVVTFMGLLKLPVKLEAKK